MGEGNSLILHKTILNASYFGYTRFPMCFTTKTRNVPPGCVYRMPRYLLANSPNLSGI